MRRSLSDYLFTLSNEAKGVSTDHSGRLHFEHYTRKEIAERLGVSPSTVRRWLTNGVPEKTKYADAIKAEGKKAVRRVQRKGGRDMGGVAVSGHRRQLKEWAYKGGRLVDTGGRTESDWINYDVSRLSLDQIVNVAAHLRDTVGYIQIIYEIRHGDGSEKYGNGTHASTFGEDVRDFTDEDLRAWIESLIWRYLSLHGYDEEDEDDQIAARMAGLRPNRILYIGANRMAIPPTERL